MMYRKIVLLFFLCLTIWIGDAQTRGIHSHRKYALQEHEAFYNLTLSSDGNFEYHYTLFRYGQEFVEQGTWLKEGDTLILKDKVNNLLSESRTEGDEVLIIMKDKHGNVVNDIEVSINGNNFAYPNKRGEIRLKKEELTYANLSKRRTYLIQHYKKSGHYPIETISLKNATESVELPVKDILANYFVITISEGLNHYQPRERKSAIYKNSLFFYDYTPLEKGKAAKFLLSVE